MKIDAGRRAALAVAGAAATIELDRLAIAAYDPARLGPDHNPDSRGTGCRG